MRVDSRNHLSAPGFSRVVGGALAVQASLLLLHHGAFRRSNPSPNSRGASHGRVLITGGLVLITGGLVRVTGEVTGEAGRDEGREGPGELSSGHHCEPWTR